MVLCCAARAARAARRGACSSSLRARARAAAAPAAARARPPPEPTLRARLLSLEPTSPPLRACLVMSGSAVATELLALAGFDALVLDSEHGACGSPEALGGLLRAARAGGAAALVRVPAPGDLAAIGRALDLGADGVVVPMVHSAQQARSVAAACAYPPLGTRGAAHPLVRASAYGLDAGYLAEARARALVLVQVESASADAGAVAQVDGVDGVFVGPLDLAASVGRAAEPAHPQAVEARRRVEEAVRATGKALTGFAAPGDSAAAMGDRGYALVADAVDLALLRDAAVERLGRA